MQPLSHTMISSAIVIFFVGFVLVEKVVAAMLLAAFEIFVTDTTLRLGVPPVFPWKIMKPKTL